MAMMTILIQIKILGLRSFFNLARPPPIHWHTHPIRASSHSRTQPYAIVNQQGGVCDMHGAPVMCNQQSYLDWSPPLKGDVS
eukprot:scaffold67378_cov36-Tisochrysis_lutea.AAC.2